MYISPDKMLFFNRKVLIFFLFLHENIISYLFLHENISCGYSFETPRRGTSNEYPQHIIILWRNKKMLCGYPSCLELCMSLRAEKKIVV